MRKNWKPRNFGKLGSIFDHRNIDWKTINIYDKTKTVHSRKETDASLDLDVLNVLKTRIARQERLSSENNNDVQ